MSMLARNSFPGAAQRRQPKIGTAPTSQPMHLFHMIISKKSKMIINFCSAHFLQPFAKKKTIKDTIISTINDINPQTRA